MKIAALCDSDTATALRLAGIKKIYQTDDKKLMTVWNEIKEEDDVGLLFITEKIAHDLGKYLIDYRIRNTIPVIVEISDKKGHMKDHVDYVSNLIKKAVGIEVNKET